MSSRNFLFIALVLVGFLSCKSKSAYDYNQNLVKLENSITNDIGQTENLVGKYVESNKYDSIVVVSTRMERLIEDRIETIQKMQTPEVKEAENFKEAYIRYFRFMQSIYTTYKNFGEQDTDAGRLKESQKMDKITARKNEEITALQNAQRKYAEANGFKLEK
jgi:hypothetical protein